MKCPFQSNDSKMHPTQVTQRIEEIYICHAVLEPPPASLLYPPPPQYYIDR